MDLQEAIDVVEQKLGRSLRDVERHIFWGSWHGMTYDEMAKQTYDKVKYESNYLKGDIGHKFWSELSEALGEKVSKRNFKGAIEKLVKSKNEAVLSSMIPILDDDYVSRPDIDPIAEQIVLKQGSLILIKGAPKMGKTTVLSRLIKYVNDHGCTGFVISMRDRSEDARNNLDKFLEWFCITVSVELGLQQEFINYKWDTRLGDSKLKARCYFEAHVLSQPKPIVLGLDELGKLIPASKSEEQKNIAGEFFSLLRTWHENAKRNQKWSRLHLILSYAFEYRHLTVNQSPFNIGTRLEVHEFNKEQIEKLESNYDDLELTKDDMEYLTDFLGGHPYFVRLTLEQLIGKVNSLENIRKEAERNGGIYQEFLQQQKQLLKDNNLITRFKEILDKKNNQKQDVDSKLEELGLIRWDNSDAIPRNKLYESYFQKFIHSDEAK